MTRHKQGVEFLPDNCTGGQCLCFSLHIYNPTLYIYICLKFQASSFQKFMVLQPVF